MKKKLLRRSVAMAAAISLVFSNTASAGVWQQKAGNWFVKDEKSGKNLTGWYQDEKKDWYYLEPSTEGEFNGVLRAGWFPTGNDWYFLNPIHDGSFGRMFANTWLWVDGYCYYFDASGKMLAGTKTPDGYTVNKKGQWTVDGVVQYIPGKGIITKKSNSGSDSSDSGSSSGSHSGNHGGSGNNGANNGGTDNGNNGGNTGNDAEKKQVTLTVKYMDADTKEILDTRVLTGKTGENVEIEHLEIGGYTILDNQPVSTVLAARDTEVYVLYRKVLLSGEITIRYVDSENNQVIAVSTVSGRIGDTYIVYVPVIDGYKAVTEEDQVMQFNAAQQTATVEYRPIGENEEPDQKIIPNSRLKVAKADSEENKEVLSQIYKEIFDYQNHEDGTIDLAVYKDNPILDYIEDGRFMTNDIVSIDPTEEFPRGLTFIYQSHDDNYTGEYEDEYNAENYEVIHAWQATAFSMYAPGTDIDVEIPVISEDILSTNSEWVAGQEENGVDTYAADIATYAGDADKDITFKPIKGSWKKKIERASGDKGTIESELKASYDVGFGAKKLVIKIHIPFLNETDIITKKKYCEFKFEPIIKSNVNLSVKTSAEYGDTIPILEEISQNRENKVGIEGFAIQGLDFEDLGLYPFAAQGYNLLLHQWSFKAEDILANENGTIDESSLSVYIGAVESLVFKMVGSIEIKDSFEFTMADVVLGIRFEKKNGSYVPENLSTVKAPSFKLTAEGKAGVDNLDAGISFMPMASVSGVIPVGIEVQGGLTFSDTEAVVKATLEAGGDLKEPKLTTKATGKIALSAYAEIIAHIRLAGEIQNDSKQIELISKDVPLLKRKTWPIMSGTYGFIEEDTAITVYNEQDEFRISDNEGNDSKKTVHPIADATTGRYRFDCPAYILKQDENGKEKAYSVTELHINLPRDMEAHSWESITLPNTIKKLKIDQILTETCKIDLSKATALEEISVENLSNQISSIDLRNCSNLKKAYIASDHFEDLELPTTNFLEDLRIDGRHGNTFNSLNLPANCSTLKNLELYRTDIKELDTSGMRGLESLTVMWTPLLKLDVSSMTGLKELNIQETDITSLDVSANKDLAKLSTSATLEKFTGNGKVMPNTLNLTWYEDPQKTKPIEKGTVCAKGQTIYSKLYKGEKITDIWGQDGTLDIAPNTKFRPADEYGNELTDWPGYDSEKGAASAYADASTGYWHIQLPQYVLDKNNHGYKVLGVVLEHAYWGDIDGSEAPDLEKLYIMRSGGAGRIYGKLTFPKNLRRFKIDGFIADERNGFECDFREAVELEEIVMGTIMSKNYNFDLSQNTKLKTLELNASNTGEPSSFSIKLPVTSSLENVRITRSTDGKGIDEPVDLSGLIGLKTLYLSGISQEELDLSDQENLEDLTLVYMPIKELNLDKCQMLKRLQVGNLVKLEHLDISKLDGLTKKGETGFSANSYYSLKTFTGNGYVIPDGYWYRNPEKTEEAYTCQKGETIYSSKYDISIDGTETVSLSTPIIPETASNALRKSDFISEEVE